MVIHVILPTYQPDLLWLEGQLRSILDQLVPLRVWLSPDGPDDGAKRVAENLDDGRITILSFGKRAGVTGNVQRAVESALREAGTSDLFAFSDQDDIWLPGNLASGIASLPSDPIAMSTHDARVTNANGTILSSSLNAYESRHRSLDQLSLLIANTISGMTIVATRGAIERALPFPDSIPGLLHDWWLALVVSGVGQIARIETALIDYRQHSRNLVGAKSFQQFKPISLRAQRPFLGAKYRAMAREAFASRQRIALELRERGAIADTAAGFFLRRQARLLLRSWRGDSARYAVRCGIGALLARHCPDERDAAC